MTEDKQVYGTQTPLYSITNVDATAAEHLDNQSPFDFYNFLKYSKRELSPTQFNDAYQKYLTQWSETKKLNATQTTQLVRDRYIELLKDITLNYLTFEERRFISAAIRDGLSNSYDIDILIPFYSRKLREVCSFYADKREKLKYTIKKNQEKGSTASVTRAINEAVSDYLVVSDDESLDASVSKARVQSILKNLDIEVEELYDLYSSYLDNSPNLDYTSYGVMTALRKELYTANINKIDADLFINFDDAVKTEIFKNLSLYLSSLGAGLSINYNLDTVNLDCKPDENLYSIITTNKEAATQISLLRKRLIQKYIGADFYYIKTGTTNTEVTSGKLFTADNPTGNLLNRHFPTTASVEETSALVSFRKIGLFFRPEKNGILYFSAPECSYKINHDKLEPNKVYIFPDPSVYGNTTGLTNEVNTQYPLIHTQDFTPSIYNSGSFHAEGDIKVDPYKQSFYAYYAQNQIADGLRTNLEGLTTNFASKYDQGVISQWSCDIYGNQYALLKHRDRKTLVDERTSIQDSLTTYELYDGGIIRFSYHGALPEQISSDSSLWPQPNTFASNYYYNALFDGGIGAIINGIMVRPTLPYKVYYGMLYSTELGEYNTIYNDENNTFNNGELILDSGLYNNPSFSPDLYIGQSFDQPELILNDNNNTFNNGELIIDCGLYIEPIRYAGDFTLNYVLTSVKYKELDGGPIELDQTINFAHDTGKNLFINQVIDDNQTKLIEFNETSASPYGKLYVRNISTGDLQLYSDVAAKVISKHTPAVKNEMLNYVESFGIYNDLIYFNTENYFIIDRIGFNDNIINLSKTNNVISVAAHDIVGASDPFFFETREYAMMCVVSAVSASNNAYYFIPTIYKIDYSNASLEKVPIQYENAILDGEGSIILNGIAIAPLYYTLVYDGLVFTTPASYQYDVYLNYNTNNLHTSTIIIDGGSFISESETRFIPALSTFKIDMPISFVRIGKPKLVYNSRNNLYTLIATLYDMNDVSYIYQMYFTYDEFVMNMKTIRLISLLNDNSATTLIWSSSITSTGISINSITTTLTSINNEGILTIYGE